jgi:hypothetical protein
MIEGSSGEFSTIYTVMKHAQKICSNLGQLDTVITFDLAIYMKAKQIQMKFPDEFSDTVIRLGGFTLRSITFHCLARSFRILVWTTSSSSLEYTQLVLRQQ